MKRTLSLVISMILCAVGIGAQGVYVFTSFHEPSTDGLRYLYSYDGLAWDSIPGVWLYPAIDGKSGKVLRDPSVAQGPDGTFHLVWTTQWKGNKAFGYASSKDLRSWENVREIPVMEGWETNNVWAPELFYVEEDSLFMIIWSSGIPENEYTSADKLGQNAAHRMYYCTTRDFVSFSETKPYYDPGFNSIDGFLLKHAPKDYVLIVKDNRKPGFSNLFCVFSESPYGPFHSPSQTFGRTYSEGPCAILSGDEWIIYYDQYRPQEYGAVSTKDFRTFVPMQEQIKVPRLHKHGTIIKVGNDVLKGLLDSDTLACP